MIIEGLGLPFINDKGGHPLAYYVNSEIETVKPYLPLNGHKLELVTVLQPGFIDIGAGVPAFED